MNPTVKITNTTNYDFEHCRQSLTMTHTDGTSLTWTLPDKLIPHLDMQQAMDLLHEELNVQRRIRHNTPWLFGDIEPIPYP